MSDVKRKQKNSKIAFQRCIYIVLLCLGWRYTPEDCIKQLMSTRYWGAARIAPQHSKRPSDFKFCVPKLGFKFKNSTWQYAI